MNNLESQILAQVQKAMGESIQKELVGYNKPLSQLTEDVISKHKAELFDVIDGEVTSLIGGEGFKEALKSELNNKLARVLIQKMGGELEKQVNELKSNPTTRAKITLAIESAIKDINP